MLRIKSRHKDWTNEDLVSDMIFSMILWLLYLKLALSIHTQPIFTTHRPSGSNWVALFCRGTQGFVRPGSKNPLSLANCSRQIGRNSVNDTITNTSLMIRVSVQAFSCNVVETVMRSTSQTHSSAIPAVACCIELKLPIGFAPLYSRIIPMQLACHWER
jgi:hypothetical protein